MDIFEVFNNRHSYRAFSDQPVEEGKMQRILEAVNRAPSAGNRQAYQVYLVRSEHVKQQLTAAALEQGCIAQAPLALVFCTDAGRNSDRYGERGRDLYALQDASIACTFAMLAATALGLGVSGWALSMKKE